MLIEHIGLRVRDFYKIARLSDKWEAMMGTNYQQKPEALTFRNNHGLNATRDAFKVSRSTLYRWRKLRREGGLSGRKRRS